MPATKLCAVHHLTLDLRNFRTVPQKSELGAIRAMISINPEWFWALMESILEDGYHVTENIIVLEAAKNDRALVVKEGNRRVAALKLIFGLVRRNSLGLPAHIESQISTIQPAWKTANANVPCAVYQPNESAVVDRIVRAHSRQKRKGRTRQMEGSARARHSRDMRGQDEFVLDLLERYLRHGTNLTARQRERRAGDYPLTVLEEALKRMAPRFSVPTSRDLALQYPTKIRARSAVEDIFRDIGMETLGFAALRDPTTDFAAGKYALPAQGKASGTGSAKSSSSASTSASAKAQASSSSSKPKALAIDDPRRVMRELRRFSPVGPNRDKVVTLLEESRRLKLSVHPHAFCFLLRSMFEISAKAYCRDHGKTGGPAATKSNGEDRALVDILRDVTSHMTKNKTDKAMIKLLHGAMAELAKANGFLSVTSLNQLIHSPHFSVKDTHISTLFGNVFPLLEAMNS